MARLSDQEKAMLKKLQDKAEAPDAPAVGRAVNVTIDLGDEKQVQLAQRYGLLPEDETEESGSGGEEEEESDDDAPKRRGYFDK